MGNWLTLAPTDYIRSSVLGGAVVSEVDATGKKKLTNVYAAGTKIATQAVLSSTPYESVSFEHSDPGGASQRTTLSNGFVANLSVEFDPSGANTGTATPYTEPDPEPEDLEPAYHMLTDAPLMVNGFVPPCTVDGILQRGGCDRSWMKRLGYSLNIDFRFTNNSVLTGLGIFAWHPPDNPGGSTDTSKGFNVSSSGGGWRYSFISGAFEKRALTKEEVESFRKPIKSLLDKKTKGGERCNNFFTKLLDKLGRSDGNDFMQIFERIADRKGFYLDTEALSDEARSTVGGTSNEIIAFKGPIGDLANDPFHVIHEVFHAAAKGTRYNHFELAVAARSLAISMGYTSLMFLTKEPVEGGSDEAEALKNEAINQGLINTVLETACKTEPRTPNK